MDKAEDRTMNSEAQAWFSLSQTQRRLAHEYKRWALEAEKLGQLERYREYRKRSDELWQSSKWSLNRLRSWRFPVEHKQEMRRAA